VDVVEVFTVKKSVWWKRWKAVFLPKFGVDGCCGGVSMELDFP
jgi:hypothetical protein